jgi:hypothetical protein
MVQGALGCLIGNQMLGSQRVERSLAHLCASHDLLVLLLVFFLSLFELYRGLSDVMALVFPI